MKKIILFAFFIVLVHIASAQRDKQHAAATHPASQPGPMLKTNDDSVSYAIGLSVANFFKQQNVQHVNTSLVSRAIQDIMQSGSPLLNEQQANAVIMACMNRSQLEKNKENAAIAEKNKAAGDAFLAENKKKPGVVELPSGLQYQVITAGTGPKPASTDKIKCHYTGTLLDGTVFDSSVQRGEPLQIQVDRVIPGWTEALQLMPVGSKWRLFIPSKLAYGDQGAGQVIKPGSTLLFDVELLEIVKP